MPGHRLIRAVTTGATLGVLAALNIVLMMFMSILIAWSLLVLYSWRYPHPTILAIGVFLGLVALTVELAAIDKMVRR